MVESGVSRKGTLPIMVNKDVVKHLSIGLYRNFALAIKELVSNSYDAGATEVKIRLDLKKGKIIIRDNGKGMGYDQFKNEYLHIGFFREPADSPDELGRMRIGTFGIGFLAPLPYCRLMHIITKERGSENSIEATIEAENFFRRGTWDIRKERVRYEIKKSEMPKKEGETILVLEGIKPQIAEELSRKGMSRKSIDRSGFDKFRWTLCQYAPIQFPPDRQDLRGFFSLPDRVPLRLWLDGEELFRNLSVGAEVLEMDLADFGSVSVKYTIMSPMGPVKPEEARGLQVRLKDVAIGLPRDFDVTKLGRVLGKLNFLCGEVHITEGLDSALMVHRDNFNYTEEIAQMNRFFQRKLREWNDTLYRWLDKDKKVYEALGELTDDDKMVEDLFKTHILHFSKERLRLPKAPITKTKKAPLEKRSTRVVEALKETKRSDTKILQKKVKAPGRKPPIKVDPSRKTIVVYENHPAFAEKMKLGDMEFEVDYESWDHKESPYSICRLKEKENRAIFNKSHPLFESKLSDDIIKRLSLGILLIVKEEKNREDLIRELNLLLEDAFLR